MSAFAFRHRLWLLGALCLAVALSAVGAVHYWQTGRFAETTDDAYVGGDVTVMASKVAGFIAAVPVSDNQAVHAGDLLVKIDDRDYQLALAKADAAVEADRAALDNLGATRDLQRALISQARAALAAASAEIERARFDQERYKVLAANAAASIQTFQKADAQYKEAVADADKARAALLAAERELQVIDTRKMQLNAALTGAETDEKTAQLNLQYTEVRAPIDGVIGNRSARLGAYATAGAELLSVVPAHGLWVDANFKESQLKNIHPGSPVQVAADALPGERLRGRVVSISPATGAQFSVLPAENATGNFTKIVQRVPVRILLDGDAATLGRLRPGFSVSADVDGRKDRIDEVRTAGLVP
jgi:membrane fusion protein, multidrug efflux system